MKQKDALTDLVEHAQDAKPPDTPPASSDDRQVANTAGEIITLGQQPASASNKSVSLELQQIVEMVRRALEKAIENARARLKKRE